MPERDATNGLNTFSLHAFEQSSAGAMDQLRQERSRHPGFALDAAAPQSDVDPETTARRYLGQALESAAVPALTAPEAAGTTSKFKTISTETVPLTGTKTVKFRQTLHEIPVYGSLVTVELDDANDLVSIDSALGEPEGVEPVADVSPAAALAAAKSSRDGYTPALDGVVPRLNYFFDRQASNWRLVYILEDVPVTQGAAAAKGALEPPRFVDYVVDAHSGDVVTVLPRTPSVAVDTAVGEMQTGLDAFGKERTFMAVIENGHLVLRDSTYNVQTYDFGFADPVVHGRKLPGETIGNPPAWTPAAVSSHANAVAVADFLRTVLMRNNIDDKGGPIISTINCVVASASPGQKQWLNAFWNNIQMVYGQVLHGTELRSLAANIDVVAHEIFHGVTDNTSRLEYAFQPGALNESYSDIFGTIIANQGNPDPRTWDWRLGEGLKPGGEPFRDLANPPLFGQPDHMRDFKVKPNNQQGDWGGVHINSGIPNKGAYLLLTAENADGSLKVTPVEVAAVFYLALTQRLSRTSQFADSRRAVIMSARTLFRNLPAAEQDRKIGAIEASFDAVGIS